MKSLEIIKRKINEIYGFDDKWEEVEELETIKQDLEVLEILRKYLFVIGQYENNHPNSFIALRADMDRWGGRRFSNYIDDEKIVNDFNKVKQWLEVNEE